MSAETLRRAADLMRERAEDASGWDGLPWFAVDGAVYGGTAAPHQVVTPVTTYDGDAEHIASWHPAVAIAVADWLDATALLHADDTCSWATTVRFSESARQADRVARAYLGESA